jgi:hypothetical protein
MLWYLHTFLHIFILVKRARKMAEAVGEIALTPMSAPIFQVDGTLQYAVRLGASSEWIVEQPH